MVLAPASASLGANQGPQAPPCLSYEPDTIRVSGRLERLIHPGPPNYDDTTRGDRPEPYFYLRSAVPLCFRAAGSGDSLGAVYLVQLILPRGGYARLRPRLGKIVALTGTAFQAQTGNHHAPVVLTVALP